MNSEIDHLDLSFFSSGKLKASDDQFESLIGLWTQMWIWKCLETHDALYSRLNLAQKIHSTNKDNEYNCVQYLLASWPRTKRHASRCKRSMSNNAAQENTFFVLNYKTFWLFYISSFYYIFRHSYESRKAKIFCNLKWMEQNNNCMVFFIPNESEWLGPISRLLPSVLPAPAII